MRMTERIEQLVQALPSDSATVTLTRADLHTWLADSPTLPAENRDLTVEEVGELMGRSPSTIRGWLIAGDLVGYKLFGRSWRVTRTEYDAFRARQATPKPAPEDPAAPVDISEWRKVR